MIAGITFRDATLGDFALIRFDPDGSLDPSFGDGGVAMADLFGGKGEVARSIALQRDGKLVVAGEVAGVSPGFNIDLAVARFNADGSIDASFGDDGAIHQDIGGNTDTVRTAVIQESGRIIVAGTAMAVSKGTAFFALAAYQGVERAPSEDAIRHAVDR